jgi:hypothetical protein
MGISKFKDELEKLDGELVAAKETVDKVARARKEIRDAAANESVHEKFAVLMGEVETARAIDPNFVQRMGNYPFCYDIISKVQPGCSLLKFMGEIARKEKSEDNSFVK